MSVEALQAAADAIRDATGNDTHSAAVVLGSGLSEYAASKPAAIRIPYAEIPGFPVPSVAGHGGDLYSIDVAGSPALLFAGRVHAYEGWDLSEVVFGVRTAAVAGCHTVLLTNASGGVSAGLQPGDLVAIRDHINFTGRNPLVGANDPRLGERFPDLSDPYSKELRTMIATAIEKLGHTYKEGVYAWLLGPSYETPSEIEAIRRLGADLVGMSTVPESIALNHMGVRVGGLSLVTNLAAGATSEPLSHHEVQAAADATKGKFTDLIDALLPRLVEPV